MSKKKANGLMPISKIADTVLIIAFSFCMLFQFSCSKEDECEVKTLSHTSLGEEYNCNDTGYQTAVSPDQYFTVINSQSEYISLVSSSCTPSLDFTRFTLIIGKQGLPNGSISIAYE